MLRRRYPAPLVLLGLVLALPSLWGGVQLDDFTIRAASRGCETVRLAGSRWEPFTFLDGDPEHTRKLMERGLVPWWTDPHCRLAFMRPLTAVTHMLDYLVWPDLPWLMHLQSLLWFALLIWAVATLYRRLICRTAPAWIAALAGLLFTLDDAHAMPVGWLANRNALLAAVFGVLTLIAHDRWRRDGWRPGGLLAPWAMLVGLLCKETAVSAGGYLLVYAIFLDPGRARSRWLSLVPYLVVGGAWYAVYRQLGFGVAASGVYADPAHDPMGFARHVTSYAPVLLLGQWGLPMSDVGISLSAFASGMLWLWAIVFLAMVGGLLVPLVARDALARFWTLGMALSLLPACLAFPMDRLLMFVGLGAMGLLAQWLGGLQEGASWVPRRAGWKRPARVFAWLFVAIHLVVAPPIFLAMLHLPKILGHEASPLWDTFPTDPQLPNQTVVIVNPVSLGEAWLRAQIREYHGEPFPASTLLLTSACSTVRLKRIDERTLVVRPRGGYLPPRGRWPECDRPPVFSVVYAAQFLERLVRGDGNPLRLGETIELKAVTIEIGELTGDGRPASVSFRFRAALEDPSLRWLQATKDGYVPFRPPAIGATVEVPSPVHY